jgi:hypothetical protein
MRRMTAGFAFCCLSLPFLTTAVPMKSKLYSVQSATLGIDDRNLKQAQYSLIVNVNGSLKSGYYLEVEFEDPCQKKQRLTVVKSLESQERKILLQSPPVGCLVPGRTYIVWMKTYDSSNKGKLVDRLRQPVHNILDFENIQKMAGE